jgi:lysophospholipase L1-like esterase
LLQIGGNDVVRFTNTKKLRTDLRDVLAESKKRGDKVVVMSNGDVGNAPAFGPVLSFIYHIHTQTVRAIFIEETTRAGVLYVDLYEPKASDPFAEKPLLYHAADGFHPSSAGYGLWFSKLSGVLKSI